jgi:C2 domain
MTEKQIEEEHIKPSTRWIETGSGKLGRVYVEILRCDALPNTDTGVLGDMTDAFCNIIFEDAIVNTDVINDELNPRWMPWSQRAFIFHLHHASSQILVGVFDFDTLSNKPIGRISIDITNLSSNTEYVLTYELYKSVLDEVRPPQGTLTVRLRLDVPDFRKLVVASLSLPPANFVNVAKVDHFRSARFVTHGEENLNKLDMDALKSYGSELLGYRDVVVYVQQAVLTVLLWRGHYQVNIYRCKFKLPLHSMVAFVMGISLIEDFNLLPSFFFFCIAWFFLATNEQRQRNPSPWHKSATFGGLWFAFLTGKTWSTEIVPNNDELQPLIIDYTAAHEVLLKTKEAQSNKGAKQMDLMDAYFVQEEEALVDEQNNEEGIETTTGGFQLNVLKPILLPIQKVLGQICGVLRIARSIVTWDESLYAFAIVNVSLFAGTILFFVPWSCLVRWILRVVVWTLLGPWMKLVDVFVVAKLQAESDNLVKRLEHSMEQRSLVLLARKRLIMIRKEEALKLRAMKTYMFGQYIARVPRFKDYRFPDVPRSESSATPHEAGYSSVHILERKNGQKLVGHMIPTWGDEEESAILTAQASTKSTILGRINPMNMFKVRMTS